jgi:hypothetical protein
LKKPGILGKLIPVLVLVLFSALANAQSMEKLTPAQKRNFDTFFSNFSEANVQSFKRDALSDEAMIEFALSHNYINKRKSLQKSKDGQSVLISAELVDRATIKYFGRKVSGHKSQSYTVPLADGEAYTFSQITQLINIGEDMYQAEGAIYTTGSGGTPDPHGTPAEWKKKGEDVTRSGSFSAIVRAESERYILLEYIVR